MAEPHRGCTGSRLGIQSAIAGLPGRRFRPDCARLIYVDSDDRHIVVAERCELIRHPASDFGRVILQTVIDHHGAVAEATPGCHVADCERECERVRASRAGDDKM